MKFNKKDLIQIFEKISAPDDFILDTEKISTDTRKISKGEYFFPISGPSFDGNKFINEALKKGASAIFCSSKITDKELLKSKTPFFLFRDDKKALYDLSNLILNKVNTRKIAITGSNGKTTCKEILNTLLSSKFSTLSTIGNFNNNIGLPLTLFKTRSTHELMVLELGMNSLGEIDHLASLVKPHYSIITNVARAHLEFLKTIKNISIAKCELIPHTKEAVILNSDSEILLEEARKHRKKLIKFSLKKETDIYLKKIIDESISSSSFIFRDNIFNEDIEMSIPLPGTHNIYNFLAAFITARLLGLNINEIKNTVPSLKTFNNRYSLTTINGMKVINDSYNANPDSMEMGLLNFSKIKNKPAQKYAILGDMKELGPDEDKFHYELGNFIAKLNIDHLITYGKLAKLIADGAGTSKTLKINAFLDFEKMLEFITESVRNGDFIFLKASNSVNLSRVLKHFEASGE